MAERDLPVIVLGGGGHAKVLVDALVLQGREALGYTSLDRDRASGLRLKRLGDDRVIAGYDPATIQLVNAIGSIKSTLSRQRVFEQFRVKNYRFATVIHPAATVAADARVLEGVQIMAKAVVQPGATLGENVIVNTGALVDHDCEIGAHAHIAPGVVLSGGVQIAEGAHIGTGAVVMQGVAIGVRSVIGAGAVVIDDVPAGVTVIGVPGKILAR